MINFSTEFPIDTKNGVPDVVRLACESIETSPHSKISRGALTTIPAEGEHELIFGNERVIVGAGRGEGFEIGGVRYVRVEKNALEWTITSVAMKTPERHLLSIQVSCEALNTAIRLPAPRKPYFIRQVIAKLGGGMDGSIPVADQAFYLSNDEVNVAAELILGIAENRLPIVYVSSNFEGSYIVEPARLARLLSGMAHVIVEPDRTFSIKLKPLVASRNVYGGTVGVYWPESNARKAYYFTEEHNDADSLHSEIVNDVRLALSHRRQMTECSWTHLRETISRNRYEKLKAEGSTELNAFIDAFDSDLKAKENRIAEAETEIARLNSELRKYAAASQSSAYGILKPGNENDFYDGEINDIAVDALADALRNMASDSRRWHVIADLVAANPKLGEGDKIKDDIKGLFRSYASMDSRTRSALGKLGFDLSEEGKHYKAVFHGDGRYTFSISKTGSDRRGGRNMASDINKRLF